MLNDRFQSANSRLVILLACSTISLGFLLLFRSTKHGTVKLGNKELFDKEQIGIKEPFPVTNFPFTT